MTDNNDPVAVARQAFLDVLAHKKCYAHQGVGNLGGRLALVMMKALGFFEGGSQLKVVGVDLFAPTLGGFRGRIEKEAENAGIEVFFFEEAEATEFFNHKPSKGPAVLLTTNAEHIDADTGFYGETVFEDLAIKQEAIRGALDRMGPRLSYTGTSTYRVSKIAEALTPEQKPCLMLGHPFTPVYERPFEVGGTDDAAPELVQLFLELVIESGMMAYLTGELSGHGGNNPFMTEADFATMLYDWFKEQGIEVSWDQFDIVSQEVLGHQVAATFDATALQTLQPSGRKELAEHIPCLGGEPAACLMDMANRTQAWRDAKGPLSEKPVWRTHEMVDGKLKMARPDNVARPDDDVYQKIKTVLLAGFFTGYGAVIDHQALTSAEIRTLCSQGLGVKDPKLMIAENGGRAGIAALIRETAELLGLDDLQVPTCLSEPVPRLIGRDDPRLIRRLASSQEGIEIVLIVGQNKMHLWGAAEVAQYHSMMLELANDPTVKGVVVIGEGPNLSFGANVKQWGQFVLDRNLAPLGNVMAGGQTAFMTALYMPKPVVYAVNGDGYGGGAEAVACADWIVMLRNAKLGQPEVKNFAIPPGHGGSETWRARFNDSEVYFDWIINGGNLDGQQMLEAGAIDTVVPRGKLLQTAIRYAQELVDGNLQSRAVSLEAPESSLPVPDQLNWTGDGEAPPVVGMLAQQWGATQRPATTG